MAFFRSALMILAGIIILPIYLAFMFVFLALWLAFTVSGVGPFLQFFYKRSDEQVLASLSEVKLLPSSLPQPTTPVVVMLNVEDPSSPTIRRLAVRWTPGKTSSSSSSSSSSPLLPPVCIPNGLGATLISIGRLHESLAEKGFPVLSYDRAGVGQSDPLPSGVDHFNSERTVADMHALLNHPFILKGLCEHSARTDAVVNAPPPSPSPSPPSWILLGPSMGSIIAQAYIASHPEQVCGFFNMDGFPFPFAAKRSRFTKAAIVYKVYASIVWTGVLRPFLWLASAAGAFSQIASSAFPVQVVRAEINQRNFFASLSKEMITMMDCADAVREAWGPAFDFQSQSVESLQSLIRAKPFLCGDIVENDTTGEFKALPRSTWEAGDEWVSEDATRDAIQQRLKEANAVLPATTITAAAAETTIEQDGSDTNTKIAVTNPAAPTTSTNNNVNITPLYKTFPHLVVRAMSARSYNFPGGKSFYDQQMKDWAAAEHTLHVGLSKQGQRTVFPTRHHGQMFFPTVPYIAKLTMEIAEELLYMQSCREKKDEKDGTKVV